MNDRRPGLKPPRFGLRSLFVVLTLLCVLLATMQLAGGLGAAALLLFVLAVLAHVAGASLGDQLRANGSAPPVDEQGMPILAAPRRTAQAHEFAPATPLGERRSLGWTMLIVTTLCLIAGAIAGGKLFGGDGDLAGIRSAVLGSVSLGVLGWIGGFALVSFAKSLAGSVWHAHRGERRQS